MSIVGTRPPLISETNLYEPRHKVRLAIHIQYKYTIEAPLQSSPPNILLIPTKQ